MDDRTVGEIVLGRPVYVVQQADYVLDAARYMTEYKAGAVPVLSDDRLVGIFSERDLMTRVVAAGLDPALTRVGAVMTPIQSTDTVALDKNTSSQEALTAMQRLDLNHLPVTAQERLIGCVSLRELQATQMEHQGPKLSLLDNSLPEDKKLQLSPPP